MERTKHLRAGATVAAITLALGLGVAACGGRMARPDAPTAQTREALTALREATRPFQDVAAAIRVGTGFGSRARFSASFQGASDIRASEPVVAR